MAVPGDGSRQATAMLSEFESALLAPQDDHGSASPFHPRVRPASELLTGDAATAALQRRIGAPRNSASRIAVGADPIKARVARERPRSRRPRDGSEPAAATPAIEPPLPRPERVRDPEHHRFSGTLAVTVGPFDDLKLIGEFAEALTAVPGVGSVRIRTFDRASVVFDVDLDEPTAVISGLRSRSHRALRLLHANDRIIRLKLV